MGSLIKQNVKCLLQKIHGKIYAELMRTKTVYLVDELNNISHENNRVNSINKFTSRTHTCGELSRGHIGRRVTLCGWLEFQRMNKFLVLRDSYGQTQIIIHDQAQHFKDIVKDLNYESCLKIHGTVLARPPEMINKKQKTGEIEVSVEDLEVLNSSDQLPFNIRSFQKAHEALRMKHRYLDLRFSSMQQILRRRSEFSLKLREYLIRHCGFMDVETPTLFNATPGGAQEFVVPTRHKKKFFSLVQSPQQFKQMLMCGGVDRYFQIARCYRDETTRPDRQPEFTQLDIEMSFTSVEGVLELVEELLQYAWPTDLDPLPRRFPRLKYEEAIERYGTDRPDVRFGHTITDCTELLISSMKKHDHESYVGCLLFQNERADVKLPSDRVDNKLAENQRTRVMHIKASNRNKLEEKLIAIVKDCDRVNRLLSKFDIEGKVSMFIAIGSRKHALKRLGQIREDCAAHLQEHSIQIYTHAFSFLWVLDFPLFSYDDNGVLNSEHHPFTMPKAEDVELIDTDDPTKARSLSYDLVVNGQEVGGGSIRIHDAALQRKIFEKLRITGLDHMLEMLSVGCPPHGGIALGLDRLLACMCQVNSIRDVIAFPKTSDGKDPISGAPSELSEESRKLYDL